VQRGQNSKNGRRKKREERRKTTDNRVKTLLSVACWEKGREAVREGGFFLWMGKRSPLKKNINFFPTE
jgi:hypothetical protein